MATPELSTDGQEECIGSNLGVHSQLGREPNGNEGDKKAHKCLLQSHEGRDSSLPWSLPASICSQIIKATT